MSEILSSKPISGKDVTCEDTVVRIRFGLLVAAASGSSARAGCMTNYVVGNHPEWRRLIAAPEDYGLQGEFVHFML